MMTLNQPRQSETSVGLHTTAQWSSVARISKQRHYADLGHRSHIAIRIVYTEQTNSASVHSVPCEMYVISNAVAGIVKSFVVQRCFN